MLSIETKVQFSIEVVGSAGASSNQVPGFWETAGLEESISFKNCSHAT
jgi:hypothetical protein